MLVEANGNPECVETTGEPVLVDVNGDPAETNGDPVSMYKWRARARVGMYRHKQGRVRRVLSGEWEYDAECRWSLVGE